MGSQLCPSELPRRYHAEDLALLESDLQALYDDTHVCNMPPLKDLLLIPDGSGRTAGGWRFSTNGLADVSRQLCRQLPNALFNIAGVKLIKSEGDVAVSDDTAFEIFNAVLRLRYKTLADRKLITCRSTKTIDGLARAKTKHVDNRVLLEAATGLLADRNFRFTGAITNNRAMRVWFHENNHGVSMKVNAKLTYTHRRGFFLANRESSNGIDDTRTRTSLGFATLWTNGCSFQRVLPPMYRNTTASCIDVTTKHIEKLLADMPTVEQLKKQLKIAQSTPLNITDYNDDSAQTAYWLNKMTNFGVKRQAAAAFLTQAIRLGAEGVDKLVPGTLRTTAPRNVYDLYCVISSEAKRWAQDERERHERFAHTLLFDKKGK